MKGVIFLGRKKIEKIIFSLLMCLPLIIFGGLFLVQIIRNWNGINDINLETLQYLFIDTSTIFQPMGEGALVSVIEAFAYLFEILGITDMSALPYLLVLVQIIYMLVIEVIWLLYDLIIFIPRACRSIVEKGM